VPMDAPESYRSTEGQELVGLLEQPTLPRNISLRIPRLQTEAYSNLTAEKRERYRLLWRKAVFRTKIERALKKVSDEILVYGTSNELLDQNLLYKSNIDELIEKKTKKQEGLRMDTDQYEVTEDYRCLLHPNNSFKRIWNLILMTIMVYTAIVMPFRISFQNVVFWDGWTVLEFCVDGVFIVDIGLTFFSMYYKGDGKLVANHRQIVRSYLLGWFILDLFACIPFSLVDYFDQGNQSNMPQGKYNNLLRLVRIPRMYKLFRVVRILKAFRHYRDNSFLERLQDCLQLNSRLYKLVKFLCSVLLCVHIAGCFWFFSARIYDFEPETWVVRCGYTDADMWSKYLASIYWAVTTVTTVGYGDISGKTELEMILCVIWMFIGVGFYSFTIGSLSSFLTSIDTRESVLSAKMAAIQEFAKETGISPECKLKIRNAIRYNTYKQGTVWSDKHSLFNELPKALRFEVVSSMYNGIYKEFPFFSKKDPSFTIFVMPLFKPLRIGSGEYLYHEGDYADEVYFITRGRVNFVIKGSEIVYKSFLRGSYLGEIEVIRHSPRLNNAEGYGECEFLVLGKKDVGDILSEFPNERKEIIKIANERARRNKQAILETLELVKLKAKKGTIADLAGQDRLLEVIDDALEEDLEDPNAAKLKEVESDVIETKAALRQVISQLQGMKAALTAAVNDKTKPTTIMGRVLGRAQKKHRSKS